MFRTDVPGYWLPGGQISPTAEVRNQFFDSVPDSYDSEDDRPLELVWRRRAAVAADSADYSPARSGSESPMHGTEAAADSPRRESETQPEPPANQQTEPPEMHSARSARSGSGSLMAGTEAAAESPRHERETQSESPADQQPEPIAVQMQAEGCVTEMQSVSARSNSGSPMQGTEAAAAESSRQDSKIQPELPSDQQAELIAAHMQAEGSRVIHSAGTEVEKPDHSAVEVSDLIIPDSEEED